MRGRRAFLTNSGLSIANQILLSALNFLVGLYLIRLGTKETYGLYSQLFAGGIFAVAILDSLLGSPLTTLAPGMTTTLRQHVMRQLYQCQQVAAAGLALLFGLATSLLLIWQEAHPSPWLVGAAFSFFVFASAIREFQRTLWFIDAQVARVFRMDATYVLLAGIGGSLLIWLDEVNLIATLLVIGFANCIAFLPTTPQVENPGQVDLPKIQTTLLDMWDKAKWILPGTLVGWAGNYSFLYLSSMLVGLAAAADISAARLLLIPISLLVVAWSRVARPQAGKLIQQEDWKKLNRLGVLSLVSIEFLAMAYILILIVGLPWLQTHILGPKYLTITPLVWAWGVYFIINAARSITTTWLVSLGAFRPLFFVGALCLPIILLIAINTMATMGTMGAIVALSILEFIELIIGLILISRYRKLNEGKHAVTR